MAAVENHLVCRGLGLVAERLKCNSRVLTGIGERSDAGSREALFERMRAQLENADSTGSGQLQERRARALAEYLQHGTGEHWDELQRLNNEIRARLERSGNGIRSDEENSREGPACGQIDEIAAPAAKGRRQTEDAGAAHERNEEFRGQSGKQKKAAHGQTRTAGEACGARVTKAGETREVPGGTFRG